MLFAAALALLPWAPRAFSQAAPPEKATSAAEDKFDAEPGGLANASGEKSTPKPSDKPTTEERLDRLEALLEQLLQATKAGHDKKADPTWSTKPAEANKADAELKTHLGVLNQRIESLEAQLQNLRKQREDLLRKFGKGIKDTTTWGKSPAAPGELSYSLDENGRRVVATEPKSGKVVWTLQLGDSRLLKVATSDGKVVIVDENGKEMLVDPRTGGNVLDWKAEPAADAKAPPGVIWYSIAEDGSSVLATDPTTKKVVRTIKLPARRLAKVWTADGQVYAIDEDGREFTIDAGTGKTLRVSDPDGEKSDPAKR